MVADASRDFAVTPDLDATLRRWRCGRASRWRVGARSGWSTRRGPCCCRSLCTTPIRCASWRSQAVFDRPIAIDEGLSGHVIDLRPAGLVQRYCPEALDNAVSATRRSSRPSRSTAGRARSSPAPGGGRSLGVITVLRDEDHEPLPARPRRAGRDGRARRTGDPQRPAVADQAGKRRRAGGVRPARARHRGRARPLPRSRPTSCATRSARRTSCTSRRTATRRWSSRRSPARPSSRPRCPAGSG